MMWWELQNDTIKEKFRGWLQEGRLEIVNGGWSEHDEGCTYYTDMISNMQFGHMKTLQEFGYIPKIGW